MSERERVNHHRLTDLGQDRAVVRAALADLPAHLRAVLVEIRLRGRTVADAAGVLGVSPEVISGWTLDALRMLAMLLVERGLPQRGSAGAEAR